MDKEEIKKKIDRLKEKLAKHKEDCKTQDLYHKKYVAELQKIAGYQTNKAAALSARQKVRQVKLTYSQQQKVIQVNVAEMIKREIEELKAKLKPKKESGWF